MSEPQEKAPFPSPVPGERTGREGRYVMVGAGPGAVDLITVRGARVIAEADVIIWASSLVQPELVANHKEGAILIDSASASLEDLEPWFRKALDEGLTIARVHTGDPAIYGTTAEQRDLCNRLSLAHESVPGVSAFSAAAAVAGVEITVPEVSQSMILTRLEGGRTPMPPRETVRSFAQHGTTMALYLSAARNKVLQEELLAGGYPPETPCVIGHQVTWPGEMMLRCELKDLSETMREHQLWKHTIVLVGPAMAEGPIEHRSHLYHPGFRHEYRKAAPGAAEELRSEGTVPVTEGLVTERRDQGALGGALPLDAPVPGAPIHGRPDIHTGKQKASRSGEGYPPVASQCGSEPPAPAREGSATPVADAGAHPPAPPLPFLPATPAADGEDLSDEDAQALAEIVARGRRTIENLKSKDSDA